MSVILSEKHGVNPSVTHCFYCNKETGVALMGKLKGDAEAPRDCVVDMEPCEDCQTLMSQGVMLIEVRDGETGNNPYRTGNVWVVKDEAIERLVSPAGLAEHILKARFSFIPQEAAKLIGLEPANEDPR